MAQKDITNLTDAEFDRNLVLQDELRKNKKNPFGRGFGAATRGSKFKGTF
jgi:hypothetical protein